MLPPETPNDYPNASVDTVAMIAEVLKQKFGFEALAVAKAQRDLADGDTLARWDEIVARLQGQAGHLE